jgi:3-deoxy-D-manno-octulosonic-acid transferase
MYYWYKSLTYLLHFFSPIYIFIRRLKKKEHPTRYKEKLSQINIPRGEGFLLWFHVASVGEVISIFPLIENLERDSKINKILITTITLSSAEIIKKKFSPNQKIVHQFLPLDIPKYVYIFLKHWSPNLSVFIDSEIWPNLILEIKKKNIPLFLINGRITRKSFNRWKLVKNFAKKVFQKFDVCISSNKETENYLKILGAKNIKNYGNLKFANIKSEKISDSIYLNKIKNRKIWCAASTHPTEEKICAEAHLKIKKTYNNILTIIIPRHIHRIEKIKNELLDLNLKVVLHSKFDQISDNTDILLVDSYGEAINFFNISRCVFLGKSLNKSLIKDSGQNPIEPSRLGCKVFHGPNVSNFVEIYDFLHTLGAAKKINNIQELGHALVDEFGKDEGKNIEIIKKLENHGHSTLSNIIRELKEYINI